MIYQECLDCALKTPALRMGSMDSLYFWIKKEFHLLSLMTTVGLDVLWSTLESRALAAPGGLQIYPYFLLLIFTSVFGTVSLLQHFLGSDSWKPALVKGAALGLIAAFPFSVVSLIAITVYLAFDLLIGRDKDRLIARLNENYRQMEGVLTQAAVKSGLPSTDGMDPSMGEAIHYLEQSGDLSAGEAVEINRLRTARNYAHRNATSRDLADLVYSSQRLVRRYRERFGLKS